MSSSQEKLQEDRRRRRLNNIIWILGLLLFAVAVVTGWNYVHRPGFAFGDIVVHGSKQFTKGNILEMTGSREPVNLFLVSKSKIVTALQGDVRVESAEAHYDFPSVLHVNIKERKPVLYVVTDYGNYAKVDKTALVMDMTDGIKDASIPRLAGVVCGNAFIGDTLQNDTIGEVLKFLEKLQPDAKEQIADLSVDKEHKLILHMRYGFPVILGPVNELAGKAELFMTVFNEMKGKKVQIEYMDLQYSKPFVRLRNQDQ
jgi:cell division protein FtsQ